MEVLILLVLMSSILGLRVYLRLKEVKKENEKKRERERA